MASERPAKRAKQACEQCRRKKGKCSGDRPACSTCSRLGQPCFYYGEPLRPMLIQTRDARSDLEPPAVAPLVDTTGGTRQWDERMMALESTVSQIVTNLHGHTSQHSPSVVDISRSVHNTTSISHSATPAASLHVSSSVAVRIKQLSAADLAALGELYLRHRSCQPLLLFSPDMFAYSLQSRDEGTLCAILLATVRYAPRIGTFSHNQDASKLREAAMNSVMEAVFRGNIHSSTLQTLCLVVLHDLEDGNIAQALSLLSLSTMLFSNLTRQVLPHSTTNMVAEEARCCYWSIILLCRLLGHPPQSGLAPDAKTMPYPQSRSTPPLSAIRPEFRHAHANSKGDNGIMVFVFEMAAEWEQVIAYVRHFLNAGRDTSPWLTTSRYNIALSGIMSIETRLQPQLHRIKHINFRELTRQDLESCREYWTPWLLSRFMYHTMICLLNHPLLIILQLQGQKNDSELFRQQTSFYAAHHTRWILYFIAFIEARDFPISDPVIGYCAAVVATIEMQLLYSVDAAKAQKKRRNIESCRRLIRRLISTCPSMAQTDMKLDYVEDMMSRTFAANADKTRSITVDLSRIRDVLDISQAPNKHPTAVAGEANQTDLARLSRRPSVDQPDDGGSPASDRASENVAMHHTHLSQPGPYPSTVTIPTLFNGSPVRPDPSEFPAEVLFNSYGEDWWNAFECYDPDWPNF